MYIEIAANTPTESTSNIKAIFGCVRKAGLKLTFEKCHFGAREVEFLAKTVTPEGIAPQMHITQNVFEKVKLPETKTAIE